MKTPNRKSIQRDWEQKSRQRTKRQIREGWTDESKYRKKFEKPFVVGYRIAVGKNCPNAKPYDGLIFLIEDVYDEPDLLPPYGGCEYDTCECDYTRVTTDEGGRARVVLGFDNPELQAKLTTRNTSPVGFEHSTKGGKARAIRAKQKNRKPAGCTSVVLACSALLALLWVFFR